MTAIRILVLAGFLCFANALASANAIPITGTATFGFAETEGDYLISGPGLMLQQGDPDGPSFIGSCVVGAVCSLSLSPVGPGAFCSFCTLYTWGSLGGQTAQWLEPNLTFSGSALYSGGSTLSVPITVSGTVIGYQLVGCTDGLGCSLGPELFTVNITGSGTALLSVNPDSDFIVGASISFSGTATTATVPEPVSLVLTGTGLAGILAKKKLSQTKGLGGRNAREFKG
jgi:hypothetical protein